MKNDRIPRLTGKKRLCRTLVILTVLSILLLFLALPGEGHDSLGGFVLPEADFLLYIPNSRVLLSELEQQPILAEIHGNPEWRRLLLDGFNLGAETLRSLEALGDGGHKSGIWLLDHDLFSGECMISATTRSVEESGPTPSSAFRGTSQALPFPFDSFLVALRPENSRLLLACRIALRRLVFRRLTEKNIPATWGCFINDEILTIANPRAFLGSGFLSGYEMPPALHLGLTRDVLVLATHRNTVREFVHGATDLRPRQDTGSLAIPEMAATFRFSPGASFRSQLLESVMGSDLAEHMRGILKPNPAGDWTLGIGLKNELNVSLHGPCMVDSSNHAPPPLPPDAPDTICRASCSLSPTDVLDSALRILARRDPASRVENEQELLGSDGHPRMTLGEWLDPSARHEIHDALSTARPQGGLTITLQQRNAKSNPAMDRHQGNPGVSLQFGITDATPIRKLLSGDPWIEALGGTQSLVGWTPLHLPSLAGYDEESTSTGLYLSDNGCGFTSHLPGAPPLSDVAPEAADSSNPLLHAVIHWDRLAAFLQDSSEGLVRRICVPSLAERRNARSKIDDNVRLALRDAILKGEKPDINSIVRRRVDTWATNYEEERRPGAQSRIDSILKLAREVPVRMELKALNREGNLKLDATIQRVN